LTRRTARHPPGPSILGKAPRRLCWEAGRALRGAVGVLGALLIFAGIMGLTGLAKRHRLTDTPDWVTGVLSGLMGGLIGNQGGTRSAALLAFGLAREAFVATATGVLAGTTLRRQALSRIPEPTFRVAVSVIALALGRALLVKVG
jgi:hypothetical protein